MVYKCCVPNCRGNYDPDSKVHVFKFPVDEPLKTTWLRAIKRDNFTPSKYSVVCELHFHPKEIRKTSVFLCDIGQEITLPLKSPRLETGAVPSILPNCPAYLSKEKSYRESPQKKRTRRENEKIKVAEQESIASFQEHMNRICFNSLQELKDRLNMLNLSKSWDVVIKEDKIGPPEKLEM